MFLMYVDESGDTGLVNSPTRYFVLSGIVVHELRWHSTLTQMLEFRRRMRSIYGFKLREELHAVNMISRRPGVLARIPKHQRLAIIRNSLDELSKMPDVNVISVVVDKQQKPEGYDVFEKAWQALIQRFENTIRYRNFPGPANPDERGMIFADRTDEKKLTQLLRRMRHYNPVPSMLGTGYRQLNIKNVIGDPVFTDSASSYLIQAVDVIAYALQQQLAPNSYMKRKSGGNLYQLLDPILCKHASPANPQGIVRL